MNIELYTKHVITKENLEYEKKYTDYESCAKCKGRCCNKGGGCELSPNDFDVINEQTINDLLDSGVVSIDRWEGLNPIYFLRIRNINSDIIDYSWGGKCVLSGEDGCMLPFHMRGKAGRELIPCLNEIGKPQCTADYDKSKSVEEWKKYNNIISKIIEDRHLSQDNHLDAFDIMSMLFSRL